MKKFLAILVTVAMLVSGICIAIPSSAEGDVVEYSINVELLEDDGKQVYVMVDIDENPGIYMTYMVLGFNTDALELVGEEEDGVFYPEASAGGVKGRKWDTEINVYGADSNIAEEFGYIGYLYTMFIPTSNNTTFANNTSTGNFYEVLFNVKEGMEKEAFNFDLFTCQNDPGNHIGTTEEQESYNVGYNVTVNGPTSYEEPDESESVTDSESESESESVSDSVSESESVTAPDSESESVSDSVSDSESESESVSDSESTTQTPDPKPEPGEDDFKINFTSEMKDGKYYVYADLENNTGIWSVKFKLGYNAEALALEDVLGGEIFTEEEVVTSAIDANPIVYTAVAENFSDYTNNGRLATFVFDILDCEAEAGLEVTADADDIIDSEAANVECYIVEAYAALAHVEGAAADCENDQVCVNCGLVIAEALGHDEKVVSGTPADCENSGLTDGVVCDRCGATIEAQEEIPALGHDEKVVPGTPATCTEAGLTDGLVCDRCGETLTAQTTIDALGHTPVETEGKDATCSEEGYTAGTMCDVCGEKLGGMEPIEKLPHTEVTVPGRNPTCAQVGLTDGVVCDVCGEVIVEQEEIAKKSHTPTNVKGYAATCTSEGLTDGSLCSVCGEVLVPQEVIPVKAHGPVVVPGYAATCTEAGLTDGKECKFCGTELLAQEVIPALGHDEKVVPGTPATCTEAGISDGIVCDRCGVTVKEQTPIAALGHTPEEIPAVAPTCTETGLTAGSKCSVCGEILVEQEEVPALGHTPEDVAEKAATCTEEGHKAGKQCSVCLVVLEGMEKIEKIPHTPVDVPAKEATEKEEGHTAGKKCEVCGEILEGVEKIPVKVPETTKDEETKAPEGTEGGEVDVKVEAVDKNTFAVTIPGKAVYQTATSIAYTFSYDDEKFEAAGVEGLDKEDYKITENADGSFTLTITNLDKVKNAAEGKDMFKLLFKNKTDAEVKAEDLNVKVVDSYKKAEETKAPEASKPGNAQTGDNMIFVVIIALVAVVGCAAVVVLRKRTSKAGK